MAPLTREDARELFYIIGQLEGLAAREAAALGDVERAALADRLERINDEFGAAARRVPADPQELTRLDRAFHEAACAYAGSRLRALHDGIKPQAGRYELFYTSWLAADIPLSVLEHRAVVQAIRAGDPAASEDRMAANWRNVVIRNGRILDGAGNPWVHGDLAIRGGRIARIGRVAERGAREIDAAGRFESSPGAYAEHDER